uniref:Intraflagellar transport associated protein n=1 Tax=Bos indicus x Bos taurus TaxID=30522 RepID=A0A4W2E9U0_BOBOX
MPAKTPELEMMDEDRLIEEVLDKFVNCHEQTYEEFLRTFTHLSKDNVTKREAFGTNSSENNFTSIKFTQRNEPNDCRLSNKAIFLHTSSQCSEEEQIMIGDGQKAGSSFQGDLNRAGKVKFLLSLWSLKHTVMRTDRPTTIAGQRNTSNKTKTKDGDTALDCLDGGRQFP